MAPILVVGSANMDLVYSVPALPLPGQTLLATSYQTHPGGKGANQAVAAARLGADVQFCGALGNDGFGESLMSSLASAGVKLDTLVRIEGSTGNAAIFVAEGGQNMILVAPNANANVTATQVESASRSVNPAVTLAQCEIPVDAIMAAAQSSSRFILNPAPAIELPDAIFPLCWLVTPNETEAQAITGVLPQDEASCEAAADLLLAKGCENVVITLGSKGCYVANASQKYLVEAEVVQAIDATAAGDAFSGSMAHFIASGKSLEEAVRLAGKVAALSTTKSGAQPSMPTLAELFAVFSV